MSVPLSIPHSRSMRLIILSCGLCSSNIFFHIISQKARFSKKKNYLTWNVCFYFIYNLCLKHFSFYEEMSEIWSGMYIRFHGKCQLFLSDLNENWICSTDFLKLLKYEISWKSVEWEPSCSQRTDGYTDRRTDMTKLTVAFAILRTRLKSGCKFNTY